MTLANSTKHTDQGRSLRLLAQAIVFMSLVALASGVGFLIIQDDEDWFIPAMVLLVAARFAYDHFFAAGAADETET